ncbi:MAG: signal peptidase I [Proteobacteria bacterium]|nr:signal peptidase I [Pseudomonadota bacterium]
MKAKVSQRLKFFTFDKKVKQKEESKKESELKSFTKTLAAAIIFAAIVRSFLYEPFHIPSSSMKPTLLIGDYIFVSKYSYGYSKYSFPFSLNLFEGRIFEDSPQRGDAVVFRLPTNPSINYIKRVIGLPKDRIQMRDGQLYINDKAIEKAYIDEFIDQNQTAIPRFKELLPNAKEVMVLDQYSNSPQDNTGIYYVPEGHYFMMGDNRDNSQDSRYLTQVGFVPKENLIGKANIIFFSANDSIWKFWKWHKSIRFSRIFQNID